MIVHRPLPYEKRKWYGLALRHLRMARRLLQSGFVDGAVFHIYHGYECVLSAMIAANGYAVPPEGLTTIKSPAGKSVRFYPSPSGRIQELSAHKARLVFFSQLADNTKPYFVTHGSLSRFLSTDLRNDALYYDVGRDRLPHEAYSRSLASGLFPRVHQFARQVWRDIR